MALKGRCRSERRVWTDAAIEREFAAGEILRTHVLRPTGTFTRLTSGGCWRSLDRAW
jgi:hypothetical protein